MTSNALATDATARPTFGRIATAALPLYAAMLAASLGAALNTALVGRHGTASLAAFAVAIAVYSPATAAVAGVLRGVSAFIASVENDPNALGQLIRNGTWLGVIVGLLGASAVGSVGPISRLLGVPEETLAGLGPLPYLLAVSVLAVSVSSSANSVLVALRRSTLVLRTGLTATTSAVVISVLLVNGPGPLPALGLTGTGLAIACSTLIGALGAQLALRRVNALLGTGSGHGLPEVGEMLRLAKVGLPLAGTVLVKFVALGVLTFAAARLGTQQAAAHGVSETLVNLIYTAAVAVGQATVPMVATAVRDRDLRASRRNVLSGAQVAVCAVGALGVLLVVLGRWIVPLFTDDPALLPIIEALLPLVLLVIVTDALQAIFGFGMVGLRRTLPSLISTAVIFGGLCIAAVPVAETGGLTALWVALIVANTFQAITKFVQFHRHSAHVIERVGTTG